MVEGEDSYIIYPCLDGMYIRDMRNHACGDVRSETICVKAKRYLPIYDRMKV